MGLSRSPRLCKVWETLAPSLHDILKKGQVDWASVEWPALVVVWIGIDLDSQVPYKVIHDTVARCKELLIITTSRLLRLRCACQGSSDRPLVGFILHHVFCCNAHVSYLVVLLATVFVIHAIWT